MGCLFPLQLFILSYVSLIFIAIVNNSHVWHKKYFHLLPCLLIVDHANLVKPNHYLFFQSSTCFEIIHTNV
jgi:hypothetical protein